MRIKSLRAICRDIEVIKQLSKRDLASKYRGSRLGLAWTIVNPVLMLTIYTVVFSSIFKTRWHISGGSEGSTLDYALNIFCGLIVFNIFSEAIGRAPSLITSNPNYVKKIVFPLHSLGVMAVLTPLFQAVSSMAILLCSILIIKGEIQTTTILLPAIWGPFAVFLLGMTWLIASMGVYIRDISQVVTSFLT